MIKMSKISDYAVVVLAEMAQQDEGRLSVSVISQMTRLPEPTVSKVLKLLTKAGIVASTRGIRGGYSLARNPREISIDQVIEAIDGPISITSCSGGAMPDCGVSDVCSVRGRWDGVNDSIRAALVSVTLADMMNNNKNKEAA